MADVLWCGVVVQELEVALLHTRCARATKTPHRKPGWRRVLKTTAFD
jgi:hypothetical protein